MSEVYTNLAEFSKAVAQKYHMFTAETTKDIDKITRKTAKEMLAAVQKNGIERRLVKTGAYKVGWAVKGQKDGDTLKMLVYNKSRGMLTHLLENVHVAGPDRHIVKGRPHIQPVEDKYNPIYFDRVVEMLKQKFGGQSS